MKHLHRFLVVTPRGIILIIAAVVAMLMANIGVTSGWYHAFWKRPFNCGLARLRSTKYAAVDQRRLMAVFFLLIGLEVKRELMQGSLASLRQAAFPIIIAAIGA